jgi:hypothetical protein
MMAYHSRTRRDQKVINNLYFLNPFKFKKVRGEPYAGKLARTVRWEATRCQLTRISSLSRCGESTQLLPPSLILLLLSSLVENGAGTNLCQNSK